MDLKELQNGVGEILAAEAGQVFAIGVLFGMIFSFAKAALGFFYNRSFQEYAYGPASVKA